MRQAGFLAAAGEIALTENTARLVDDHTNAKYLAEQLNNVEGFSVNLAHIQTNILFAKVDESIDQTALVEQFKQRRIFDLGWQPNAFCHPLKYQ